jgi:uncharacterized tellurite resistance protein B-like protein
MFEALKSLLASHSAKADPGSSRSQDFQIAACALLLRAGLCRPGVHRSESGGRSRRPPCATYRLDVEKGAGAAMAEAEQARRQAIDLTHFPTAASWFRHLRRGFSRIVLARAECGEVIHADGQLSGARRVSSPASSRICWTSAPPCISRRHAGGWELGLLSANLLEPLLDSWDRKQTGSGSTSRAPWAGGWASDPSG